MLGICANLCSICGLFSGIAARLAMGSCMMTAAVMRRFAYAKIDRHDAWDAEALTAWSRWRARYDTEKEIDIRFLMTKKRI